MVTASVKARLTQGLQVLIANQTVVMTFKMQGGGKDESLAMPVAAIPDIIERLIVAHNTAPGQKTMLYFGKRELAPGEAQPQPAAPGPSDA